MAKGRAAAVRTASGEPAVTWSPIPDGEPLPLRGVLTAFLGLAGDSSPEAAAEFCGRFGMPGWDQARASLIRFLGTGDVTVPVRLLADLARGMSALVDLRHALQENPSSIDRDDALEAIGTVSDGIEAAGQLMGADPLLVLGPEDKERLGHLRNMAGRRALSIPTEEILKSLARAYAAAGALANSKGYIQPGTGGPSDDRPAFTVVTDPLREIFLAFLTAWQTQDAFRWFDCTGCGEEARIGPGERGPRPNVPFYGNHVECRRSAHNRSSRTWERKDYWTRKGKEPPEYDGRRNNIPPQCRSKE